jgi:peptide/nickel transport system permease protein
MEQNDENITIVPDDDRAPKARVLSPGRLVARRFLRNNLAITGLVLLLLLFAFSFLGGLLSPYRQSQVFQHDERISKEYASATLNGAFRFTVQTGDSFSQETQAQAMLAIAQGEPSFQVVDKTYSLVRESEDFYTIGEAQIVARARMLAGAFSLAIEQGTGFAATQEFASAAEAAFAERLSQFSVDGETYTLKSEGKAAAIYRGEIIALATKRVFDPVSPEEGALVSSFAFRFAFETARAAGETTFALGGESYQISGAANELIVSRLESGGQSPVCTVSDILVSPVEQDVVLDAGFRAAVRAAIRAKDESFTYPDEAGSDAVYTLERVNTAYNVRALKEARVITMYAAPSQAHPLGTDGNGMDVLTRLMYGGRVSLMVGFIVVILESLIGIAVGGVSGYFGGWVDTVLMRVVDLVNCIPFYPLVIIIGTVLDQMQIDPVARIFILMAVLGLLGWPNIARVVRGQILSLREQEFMLAAEATGLRATRKIARHLVPNVMPLIIVQATLSLGGIIITEATLSFLGLGVKYPLASWGSIINAATDAHIMTTAWFMWIPAGVLIVASVLGFNFVGDGLRDAFDPRMKR